MGAVATGVRVDAYGAQEEQRPRTLTRFHQRIAAETLEVRGGTGASRLAPALAQSAVDLNPHQIEAAAFALSALPTGGAVLADEVGLGKTIEAGLVLSQLTAEGRGRAIVLVPASLRIQWRDELASKFGIQAEVIDGDRVRAAERQGLHGNPFDTGGPVIASHAFAALRSLELERVSWDVAVIDEAHRLRNAYRRDHRTGQALRKALRRCPKLLLTATPLQNDLMEMLGLATFIDATLLGDEESFRLQYATGELTGEKLADLKARLAPVVIRTLRRQVKEHIKFTARRSLVEDFAPSPAEQELYDRVSDYLRREDSFAIPRARRALLVLVYRKILASSSFALASTLERLANGLAAELAGAECSAAASAELELAGFEEEAEELECETDGEPVPNRGSALRKMRAELRELRACAKLARGIQSNAKGDALVHGLDRVFTVARACNWPEKAVIFTEFRRTQDYLNELLTSKGYTVTCLSGDSGGPNKRQSLVDRFRNESQILLMTEAGAEGLNLQFCNLVVNYDLPWNPQRVEQRIGRCHRYGQTRDVLVVNFLNRKNAADARLYELLSQKLALFDGVFGSSDEILGVLGSGIDFERRILEIYQSCRSSEEIDRAFAALRADLEHRIEARLAAARALLFERFDGEVRSRLRLAEQEAREAVAQREATEEALVRAVFAEVASPKSKRARLARAAAQAIRARPQDSVSFIEIDASALPAHFAHLAGREGWWFAYRLSMEGLVTEERIAHLVLWFDGERFSSLDPEQAAVFASLPAREAKGGPRTATVSIGSAQEEALAVLHARLVAKAQERNAEVLDEARERWDRSVEDALLAPRRAAEEARQTWANAQTDLHDSKSLLSPHDRRALIERAEREYRRKLDDLRAAESQRYAEKDRAVADLKRQTDVKPHRTPIATAYWKCI